MSLRAANRLKHIKIDQAASADLVTAPSGSTVGQKIRVVSYCLTAANATTTVQWNSGTGPTARSGAMTLAQGIPLVRDGSLEAPVLECGSNEKLTLTLGGTPGQVSGHLTYEIVQATP
jgi:hypothetical protein